jgi:hypothetical protein
MEFIAPALQTEAKPDPTMSLLCIFAIREYDGWELGASVGIFKRANHLFLTRLDR